MAGFSYQNHPPLSNFLVDSSVFLPNYHPSIIKMPNYLEEAAGEINNSNSSCFPYSSSSSDHSTFHDLPIDPTLLHCVDNNQTYAIERRKADSSSMVIDLDSGSDQVTQKKSASSTTTTPMHQKKGNFKDGSSCSSSIHQPKDSSNEKGGKKLKKWSRSTSKDMDEKSKADNNDKKNKRKTNIEQPPTGYVHVRARRGEATDSHSLAERVRREKISKRLKLLQGLVPGCEKVASKALMLDEIINYVQSLQHQVEFLSMKLASMTPLFCDFGVSFPDIAVKLEKLDNLESPLPSMQQCINTSPSATLADHITASASIATTRKNSLAYASVPQLLQQGQMPNAFSESQDNGNLSWSLDDQRQRFINQCSFTNLCSFQENN